MIRISNIKIYEDISDDKVINIALNKYKKNQLMQGKKMMFITLIQLI